MSLRILRQTSLSTEKYTQDGKLKAVHVVLKDKPFLVETGLVKSKDSTWDLKSLLLEANLLYDSPEKEVDWIKVKPFEYTAKVNADGSATTLECFIRILSSQNENALFRIRLRGLNPSTRKAIEGLEVTTDPIQVISKPSVLRKKIEREKTKLTEAFDHPSPLASGPPAGSSSNKRARDDVIFDALNVIREQQAQQQRLIEQLVLSRGGAPAPASPPLSPSDSDSSYDAADDRSTQQLPVTTPQAHVPLTRKRAAAATINVDSTECSFEVAFRNMLGAYNALPIDDRAAKVRKMLHATPQSQYSNLVDTLWTESFQRNLDSDTQRQQLEGTDIKRDPEGIDDRDFADLFAGDLPLSMLMVEH